MYIRGIEVGRLEFDSTPGGKMDFKIYKLS